MFRPLLAPRVDRGARHVPRALRQVRPPPVWRNETSASFGILESRRPPRCPKAQSWRDFGLPVTPSLNWFDIDAALGGKFQCHLEERDLHSVVGVAKAINRFAFMRGIMESGDDSVQASLEMHLLTLTFLQQRLASPGGISALDIGCGTGWLLEAFALASNNSNSRISGFDLDVEAASRALSDPDAASAATETPPPKVFQANVLQERFGLDADTQRQLLPAGRAGVGTVEVSWSGCLLRESPRVHMATPSCMIVPVPRLLRAGRGPLAHLSRADRARAPFGPLLRVARAPLGRRLRAPLARRALARLAPFERRSRAARAAFGRRAGLTRGPSLRCGFGWSWVGGSVLACCPPVLRSVVCVCVGARLRTGAWF